MDGNEIVAAFEKLVATYPRENCDIWICYYASDQRRDFTVRLGGCDDIPQAFACSCETAVLGVEKIIAEQGKRGQVALIQAREAKIVQLRKKLAELEAEHDPLIGSLAMLKEDDK